MSVPTNAGDQFSGPKSSDSRPESALREDLDNLESRRPASGSQPCRLKLVEVPADAKMSDAERKQFNESKPKQSSDPVDAFSLLAEKAMAVLDPAEWIPTPIPKLQPYCAEHCQSLTMSPSGDTVVLKAPTGSGKTYVITQFIRSFQKTVAVPNVAAQKASHQQQLLPNGKRSARLVKKFVKANGSNLRVLFVATRRAYATALTAAMKAAGIPLVNYLDVEKTRRRGEQRLQLDAQFLMVSAESLHYVNRYYDLVVLDECTSIMKQMNSPHHKGMQRQVERAKWVICADAYVDERIFRFLNALGRKNVQFIHNTVQKQLGYSAHEVNQAKFLELLTHAYCQGQNVHFIASVQSYLVDVIEPLLKQLGCPPERMLIFDGKTHKPDHDKLENIRFVHASSRSVDVEDLMQMIGRSRVLISKQMVLWIETCRFREPVTETEIVRQLDTGDLAARQRSSAISVRR